MNLDRNNMIRAALFGSLLREFFSLAKADMSGVVEMSALVVEKLCKVAATMGIGRNEVARVLAPELRDFIAEVKVLEKKSNRPKMWADIDPKLQRELVFQYFLFFFIYTTCDKAMTMKKVEAISKRAVSRVDVPAKFRKEVSTEALLYIFGYLTDKEREMIFPSAKPKRSISSRVK